MKQILFYRVSEPYGAFSNFSPHPIELKGRTWPTSEHYFQAQKFAGTDHEEAVRLAKSPMIAARMGRSRERPLRSDWENVKNDIMHEALRRNLLNTPSFALCSSRLAMPNSSSTQPRTGTGATVAMAAAKNCLGQLLMELREQLRAEQAAATH